MSYKPRHAKPSRTKQRVTLVASTGAVAAGLTVSQGQASAADFQLGSSVPSLPSPQQFASQLDQQTRDWVWNNRNNLQNQVAQLPQGSSEDVSRAIDGVAEGIYPGMIQERTQPAAPAPQPPAAPNNPCPATAKACVDLESQQSWLQDNGKISYGKVPISSGAAGSETPKGSFTVTRKVRDEISHEFGDTPMPYSVYFTWSGHAFHQDDVNVPSAGCIHLNHQDAVKYFDTLQVGDSVYVF